MPKRKLKVGLFFGGTSPEREVSLRSGATVAKYLDTKKYDVIPIEIALDGKWLTDSPTIRQIGKTISTKHSTTRELAPMEKNAKSRIDVAMLVLHGPGGEDGTLQGMLELMGIPYTFSVVLGSALAMNKVRAKRLASSAGVPVLPDLWIRKIDYQKKPRQILRKIHGKVVIKPNTMGSSLGVTIVRQKSQLKKAITAAFRYCDDLLVEPFAEGKEITVPVLGNANPVALPTIEILPWKKSEFYDYAAKYEQGGSEHIIPARLSPRQEREVKSLAVRVHEVIGCWGLSRSDFILADNGQFYFLEVNPIPGMTPTSLAPQSAAAAGITFPQLLDKLIKLAREK